MTASTRFFDFRMDPLKTELKVVFQGMSFAWSLGCSKLKLELDCLMAINFIKKTSVVWDEVEVEVAKIQDLIPYFREIAFSFISRYCNKVVDVLTKYARSSRVNVCWVGQYPSWLCNEVQWIGFDLPKWRE